MADLHQTMHVSAPPQRVWALVSDLTRMPEWSPECDRVQFTDGSQTAVKGARFIGWNRSGGLRWFTQGEVVAAEEPRPAGNLAFEVSLGPIAIARWEYVIAPDGAHGCTIAEEWTDRRPGWYRAVTDRILGERLRHNRLNIMRTLRAIKAAAEHSGPGTGGTDRHGIGAGQR